MAPSSRIQTARRRLRVARYSIGAVAVTAFGAFGFAVRDAHPATKTGTPAVTATSPSIADSATTFGGSASISPAPQFAAPQVQSSGS
ncbi:MAG TPA: hypothetical protein VH210_09220 [Gaiellaceae bacterium]|jgi:uncharacterized membrane protein YedE/YeeE|nr:hypothetical protein [Gaiellaceae bacterium]